MTDVHISVAPVAAYAELNQRYVDWGYHGGIANADVVYATRVGDQPVGIVRRTHESGVHVLRGMHIAPEYQRQGIGTRLLRAFVADLSMRDCYCLPFVHLTSFYAQGGFTTLDESQAPDFLRERLNRYRAGGRAVLLMYRDRQERSRPC